jgi:hypothetical protein
MQTIRLQMLINPLLSLLLGLSLYLTRIQYKLIFHDNSHVAYPELGLIRLDQT